MNNKEPRSDGSGVEPLSDVVQDVVETITGTQNTEPGEKHPEEPARKGDEPVANLE